ncbi:MAG: hypothetical protein EOP48_23270 [Sphingobacteriales bacterium]|nr:MAG: hypothetical protein EOP48_23270 [Sphingobacteriales bacterium]
MLKESSIKILLGIPIVFKKFSEETVYEFASSRKQKLNSASREKLSRVALSQSNVWADTILEGDYIADKKPRLDVVSGIFENGELVGYKITYSEKAWYIGDCDYDYENASTLKGCTKGRIYESSFVSPDFETYFRDLNEIADFQSSED